MNALRFLAYRALWGLLTIWVVYTASFFLMRAVPGGPFQSEKKLSKAAEQQMKARYHLDQPWHVQYALDFRDRLRGDFGPSQRLEDYSVNSVIAQGFPVSASLGILALLFAMTLGTTAGVVSAVWRGSFADRAIMPLATLGIALPNFVLASLAILIFVFQLHWFPAGGWGTFQQLVLPALCVGAPYAAYIARLTRTGMLEVLNQDYIRTAWAKGLSARRVIVHHALRGSLVPVVSFLGPAAAGILTGSLVVERIFNIPGMGSHFVESAILRDYPLAMGMVVVYCCLLYVMNTLVDIAYVMIDPRVKLD